MSCPWPVEDDDTIDLGEQLSKQEMCGAIANATIRKPSAKILRLHHNRSYNTKVKELQREGNG